ncbi:MAG TPA: DegV family protein [Actinomycetota bacterium]|nr:DegV family protein [Actinomycetota bacterium]
MIAVVTDSAADLPLDLAARHGVRVVPLTVAFGTEALDDGTGLPPETFWDRIAAGAGVPTTASPPPEALARAYRAAAEEGAEGVVSIHLSRALSRTVETAAAAGRDAPIPVEVIDSASVSLGQGLVVLAAAAAGAGGSVGEASAAARRAVAGIEVFAVLETVDFLRRGGRVGAAKAALSDLLRIRPVLTLAGGQTSLVARARTRSRAIAEVLERTRGPAEAAGVLHSRAPEVEDVARAVREACGVEPIVSLIGAVTGSHLGPGAIGVVVLRPSSP